MRALQPNLSLPVRSALAENPSLQILSLANNPKLDRLPLRLFHADATRLDVALQNNAFTSLDAAQLPVDRMSRLRLAGNPFVCNCSLAWLWRLIDTATATSAAATSSANRPVETGPSAGDDSDEWPEWFARTSTAWDWTERGAAVATADERLVVVEDMHKVTCDLAGNADGKSRARKRFIDLQETDVQCATSILFTLTAVLLVLIVLTVVASVWLCRKRHLERLLAKHESDRPIDPWPLDHIEKFEIGRDMDRLEYEIRHLDFNTRQLPPIQLTQPQPYYPHPRNWNTPTIRSSNHYSSSQPPSSAALNHEYQEPILLSPPPDNPPPLPPRPTLPRVHTYDTAAAVAVTMGGQATGPASCSTVGRFSRGVGGVNASLSPASQAKYSRTLQVGQPHQFQTTTMTRPFRRTDFEQDEHDGDDESNDLEDES